MGVDKRAAYKEKLLARNSSLLVPDMPFPKTLALVALLSLLGACAAPEPLGYIGEKPAFGTVKLRISKDNTDAAPTPIDDSFVSAAPGTPVPVLTDEELCPGRHNAVPVDAGQTCFVSVRFKDVQRESADLEVLLSPAFDETTLSTATPVNVHLLRDKPTDDVVKVNGYHIAATYLEPMPKEVQLPPADVNLRLIQRPFGLF